MLGTDIRARCCSPHPVMRRVASQLTRACSKSCPPESGPPLLLGVTNASSIWQRHLFTNLMRCSYKHIVQVCSIHPFNPKRKKRDASKQASMTQPTDTTTPQDTKPTMHDIDKPSTSGDLKDVQSFVDRFRPVPKDLHHSLHEAVSRGQLDVIRYLLEQGAPIDARIAWVAAFRAKSIPVFELLLEHAWDINAPVEGSKTALAYVLLAFGSSPHVHDSA